MSFTTGDWAKVDNPNGGEAYINPNVPADEPSIEEAAQLTPGEVNSESWDTIVDSLSAPEAEGVDKVWIDFENGLVGVHGSSGRSTYLLAALGDKGEFSVIDDNGNVSTSETRAMPKKHHVAITEAVMSQVDFETDAKQASIGFSDSYADKYQEIMSSGSYETLEGDVVFDFEGVEGVSDYKNNDKAEKFIDQLDDIAEFYRDFNDYSLTDETVHPEIPIRPEKYATDDGYKFRARGTDSFSDIVISEKQNDSNIIELDVVAFSNRHGLANGY